MDNIGKNGHKNVSVELNRIAFSTYKCIHEVYKMFLLSLIGLVSLHINAYIKRGESDKKKWIKRKKKA